MISMPKLSNQSYIVPHANESCNSDELSDNNNQEIIYKCLLASHHMQCMHF